MRQGRREVSELLINEPVTAMGNWVLSHQKALKDCAEQSSELPLHGIKLPFLVG